MKVHCHLHDITHDEGAECWCCEESSMSPAEREQNYSDPAFLAKRGGHGAMAQAQQNSVVQKLSQLKPEHLDALIALAKGEAPQRTVIARG